MEYGQWMAFIIGVGGIIVALFAWYHERTEFRQQYLTETPTHELLSVDVVAHEDTSASTVNEEIAIQTSSAPVPAMSSPNLKCEPNEVSKDIKEAIVLKQVSPKNVEIQASDGQMGFSAKINRSG